MGNPQDPEQRPDGPKKVKRRSPGDDGKAPLLAIPNITEIGKAEWESMNPAFSGLDSLRVLQDGEGGYDFYLNVDNSYLLTELSRTGGDEKALVKYWFKYGLALCGLGMLQQYRSDDHPSNGRGTGRAEGTEPISTQEHIDIVNGAMAGLARVIVPVVRRLYKGPN